MLYKNHMYIFFFVYTFTLFDDEFKLLSDVSAVYHGPNVANEAWETTALYYIIYYISY